MGPVPEIKIDWLTDWLIDNLKILMIFSQSYFAYKKLVQRQILSSNFATPKAQNGHSDFWALD